MKIVKNETSIKRNARIGGWMLVASMILFGIALYINIYRYPVTDIRLSYLMLGGFVVGYFLAVLALYIVNRFGGYPRPDEKIDSALKGLPGDYTMYHFESPVPHLLVGPAGVWALIPFHQRGLVTYGRNRWRLQNGGFSQAYLSFITLGVTGLGRPALEADYQINAVKKQLAKKFTGIDVPDVRVLLLFTSEQMEVHADEAPLPALKIKQLKDFIRQRAKEKPIGSNQLAAVKAALGE